MIFAFNTATYVYNSLTGELRRKTAEGLLSLPASHPSMRKVVEHAKALTR